MDTSTHIQAPEVMSEADRKALLRKASAIMDGAKAENRAMKPEEVREFDGLMDKLDMNRRSKELSDAISQPLPRKTDPMDMHNSPLTDENGTALRFLGKGETFEQRTMQRAGQNQMTGPRPRLADVIQCMVTGQIPPQLRAMGGSLGSGGGFMVEDTLSAQFIDFARAKSVVLSTLGASVFPMPGPTMHLASITSDPTPAWRGENTAVAVSQPAIGRRTLTAQNIGVIVPISRELLADAKNGGEMVTHAITAAMGVKIDAGLLYGAGAAQPDGIFNNSGIATTGTVGTLNWVKLNTAAAAIAGRNEQANGIALHPTKYYGLHELLDSTGQYLQPPKTIANLVYGSTSGVTATELMMGDWTQFGVGIRQNIELEIGTGATLATGEGFGRNELLLRATARIAAIVLRDGAFQKLTGIS